MAETLGQAVLEVGIDDSRLRAGLQGVEGQVRRTGGVVQALGGILATVGAVEVFRGLIASATELENITRKLTNTLGDQGAQQAIGFLRGLSDDLGLSFNVLADSFGSFTAAASAANIPLSEQKDLFAAVSTSAQRLGLSNDAINGSLLALQQVAAKGTVQMEELRGQLGERLPTAFAATAQGLGITNAELIKLVESGRLTAEQFFPALTKGLNELNGSGTGSVPTAAQNFASLGNELEKLKAQVGTEFLPGVVAGVQELAKALGGLNVQIQANQLGFGQGLLGNLLGVVSSEGAQAVGTLQQLANTYGLSQKQARALFTDAVKDVGATTNAFGQLNLSAEQYEKILAQLPGRAAEFTKEARASAAIEQQGIQNAREAQAASDKRLDTLDKINARLKEARKQLGGLEINSGAADALRAEIASLEAQTDKGAKKLADAGVKIGEEIAKGAQKLESAAKSLQSAQESEARAIAAAADIASQKGQERARSAFINDIQANLRSDNIDQGKLATRFGIGTQASGSFSSVRDSISGGGSFRGATSLDLSSLSLDKLAEVSQATSALADANKSVKDAQAELTAATKELNASLKAANGRESNLAITVPVGATREVYLP